MNVSSVDSVTVNIAANNDAPSAAAGADQNVNELDVVTLDGTGSSDPEGVGLTYSWVQTSGPAVVLSNAECGAADVRGARGSGQHSGDAST